MYCRNCKNEIRDGSRYCKYCGAPQYTESAVSGNVVKTEGKMRRRIIIMVVAAAVLLGVFFWARAHLFSGEPARTLGEKTDRRFSASGTRRRKVRV